MKKLKRGLIFKLGIVLVLLLFIKLLMIGIGIYSARHLKGDATAINYAGSERDRSYRFSYLISQYFSESEENKPLLRARINEEIKRYEVILKNLREGEADDRGHRYQEPRIILKLVEISPVSKRLLKFPGIYEPELKAQIEVVNTQWYGEVKPLLEKIMNAADPSQAKVFYDEFNEYLPSYVDKVDRFVNLLENSTNRKVTLFYSLQYLFLLITVVVTIVALYLIFVVARKSLQGLMEGIRSMTAGDFSKRVKIISDDEIGELAEGFNFMAEKIEESYGNLEKKVEEKTMALEERNRELSILYDITASLNRSLPLDDMLDIFLAKLLGHLNVDSGSIRLMDEDGSFRLAASKGLQEGLRKSSMFMGECLCGVSALNGEAGFWDVFSRPEGMIQKDCLEHGYRTVALIPIRYKETLLGIINLYQTASREYTAQEKRLLDSLSNHLGVTIEYYNLNAKAKRLAIMEERTILAHELHDSIAQSLAFLNIQASLMEDSLRSQSYEASLDNLSKIKTGVLKGYEDVRELLNHFRTQMDEEGLSDALKSLLNKFSSMTGIESVLESKNGGVPLTPEAEVHVFHVIQEALANVRKHSKASRVRVCLSDDWPLVAMIEDNGTGFDLKKTDGESIHHMGLSIMRERASILGGLLDIHSSPGAGTKVILNIPRRADEKVKSASC